MSGTLLSPSPSTASSKTSTGERLRTVVDPDTYQALVYEPSFTAPGKHPLLIVLHGAGGNRQDAWALADPVGEHAGLAPSLLATGAAPAALSDNFVVVAPYCGEGRRSFYEEPRSKLLHFVDWVCSEQGVKAG
jgi:poly(3-hydroxybutyrate) depolymerase